MARRLEVTLVGNSRDLERAFGKSASAASAFGSNMLRLGAVAAGAAAAGIGVAVGKAAEFDRGMRNVNSIAKLSEKQLAALSKETLKLAGPTGQAPKVLTAGLYDIVSSGFKAKDAIKILGVSAKAATAGMTDTATSTKAVTAALNAYHLGAGQARKVSDILFTTVNKGVLTFEELAQNMGDLVPAAAPLGVSLEEVGAAMSTVTLQGVPAAEAATRVKNTMLQLAKPSAALSGLLKEQGFASGEAAIKAKGFAGVLQILQQATGGSVTETAKLTPEIRSLLGVVGLTGKNLATYNQHLAAHKDASSGAGAAALAFAEQSKSVSVQWDKVKASLNVLAIEIGAALLPALASVLAWTQAHWPEISAVVERAMAVIKANVAAAIGFIRDHWGTILPVIKTGFTTMQAIVQTGFNTIKTVAQATFGFLKTDAGQTFAAMAIGAVAVVKLGQAFMAVKAAVLAARAAMIALSLTNPVGVIGLAVGALAGILLKEFGPAILGTRGHLLTTAEAARSLASAVRSATAALDAMKQADLSLDQAKLNLKRTTVDLRREEQEYAAVVHKSGAKSKEGVAALDELKQARLNNRQSILDLKTAEDQQAKAHAKHGEAVAKTGDVYRRLNQQYQDTVTNLDSVIPKQSALNKQHQSQAAKEYSVKTQALANSYADLSVKVAKSDPVLSRAAAKNALVSQTAHDLTVKLNRVPTKQELKFAIEARSLPGFLESLGKLPIVSKRKATEASRGLNDGLSPFAGIARKHARAGTSAIAGQAGAAFSAGFGTGSSAGQGYAAGLDAQTGAVRSAAARLIQAGKISAAAAQKSHSASEVYKQLGRDAVDGYTLGIREKAPEAAVALKTLADGLIKAFTSHLVANGTKLADATKQAVGMAAAVGPAIQAAAGVLGLAHARGIAMGVLQGSPGIVAQVRTALNEAKKAMIEKALEAAKAARDVFSSAFGDLASAALAAFDSQVAKWKSPAAKLLEKMQLQDQINQLKDTITAGKTGLAAAKAALAEAMTAEGAPIAEGADPAAEMAQRAEATKVAQAQVLAAQKTLDDALRAQVEFNLGQRAKKEEEAHAKQMERRRVQFETQLTQAQNWLARHPEEYAKGQQKILGVLAKYVPDFRLSGEALGFAMAKGIRDSIHDVVAAAREVAEAAARVLKLKSPAKEGPMADLDKWWKPLGPALAAAIDTRDVAKAGARLGETLRGAVGSMGAMPAMPALPAGGGGPMLGGGMAMAGNGGTTVNVTVQGALLGSSVPEVTDTIYRELLRRQRRNVTLNWT